MTAQTPRLIPAMALALVTGDALAYEAAVDATFDGQLYQVTSPFGEPILRRRRYTETLTLRMRDLAGARSPGGPELLAVTRLRLDSDLGVESVEVSPASEDRFIPGTSATRLDLMTAYVEGRNYADGHLGFRVGRQYVVDPLGFWSFDGGLVRLSTPAHLAFETYGGFEQRGGLYMMSTSRFEADGVFRGSRTGLPDEAWPAYLEQSRLAPAYGFAIESSDLAFLDARLTYRKVVNRDTVVASPFPDPDGTFPELDGDRVSTEKVGLAGAVSLDGLGALRGTTVYDALAGAVGEYGVSVDGIVSDALVVGVDLDYFLPTFDGDSIWNWFSRSGTTTLEGRVAWDVSRRLSVVGRGGIRRFEASTDAEQQDDGLGAIDARYRTLTLEARTTLSGEVGERGHRGAVDVSFHRSFAAGRYDAGTRLTLADWSEAVAPERDASTLTYVLSGGLSPAVRSRVGLEWEHSMSELVGHRLRALVTLDVTVY